jgi:single-strand DNA-binding protein
MATVTIIGNLGKDVELKDINGKTVASFSVADKSGYGDNKQTNWYGVSIWDGLAKTGFVDYLKKGQQVMVTGELSTREYNGKTYLEVKRVYDIKLCGGQQQQSAPQQQQQQQQQGYAKPKPQVAPLSDDLPF